MVPLKVDHIPAHPQKKHPQAPCFCSQSGTLGMLQCSWHVSNMLQGGIVIAHLEDHQDSVTALHPIYSMGPAETTLSP